MSTIEALTDRFWSLVPRQAQVTQVVTGFGFTEGPVFSRRGYLLFSDMGGRGRILRWERGRLSVLRDPSNRANGLTFDHQGRLLACEYNGQVTRTEKNGAVTVLAKDGLQAPNDLVYAIDGNIYFTDFPAGCVYQITRRGEVRAATRECKNPNGIALSAHQQVLYVADYGGAVVRAYDLAADGALENGRVFCRTAGDGVKTDEGGHVWVAGSEAVDVYDNSGVLIGKIRTEEAPSNLCWGEGFRGIYITARTSVYHMPTLVSGTRTY